MPRRIALLVAATTSAVVVALILPLCFLVASLARDRATTRAHEQAQHVATMLATFDNETVLARAVADLDARGPHVAVVRADGTVLGSAVISPSAASLVQRARAELSAFTAPADGGIASLVAVGSATGVSVVVASVSDDEVHSGVSRAWALLAALGLVLVAMSVVVALRMGRFISVPVTEVARVAHRLREGDVAARAVPGGPPETAELGRALNALADRIHELVGEEREQVADLGHRLRTPVTALRLDADLVTDADVRDRLRAHVDHLQRSIDVVVREARRGVVDGIPVTTVVAPVVAERIAFWAALAEDQSRRLDLDLGGGGEGAALLAVGDLRELVDTLLDNVFAHTPEGTPVRVAVTQGGQSSDVVVVVEDGGPGLVTPWRGRGHSDAGSTGLGLDIVHRIAQAAGGRVDLDRSSLGGLRVTISLPVRQQGPYADDDPFPPIPLGRRG
ncbi:HAMP domain-containing sensor histidine kinase [Dermatophilaceae bacterium Soc4.6]